MKLRSFLGRTGAALVVLLLHLACIDPLEGGSVNGTSLYAFDGATGKVMIWNDVSKVYDASTMPAPDRTLSGTSLEQIKDLGWGGMAMDPSGNRLLLVSKTGEVVRIERVRSQSGTLTSANDIARFTLGQSSDRLGSNSVFGQAAVDPSSGTLYVTETTDTDARVWVVANPLSKVDGVTVPLSEVRVSGGTDFKGTGVAAAQGAIYAYFGGGGNILNPNTGDSYSGARLRKGAGSSFASNSSVVVYQDTRLGVAGSLGLDTSNSLLFVLRRSATAVGDPPILVYKLGAFTSGFAQNWDATLGSAVDHGNLRFLTHAGTKDWLAGGEQSGTDATKTIWLWKTPSLGGTPKTFAVTDAQILGLAFDGSN